MRVAPACRDLRIPRLVALAALALSTLAAAPSPRVTLIVGAPASAALRVAREGSQPTPPRSPVGMTGAPAAPREDDASPRTHAVATARLGRVTPPPATPCADLSALIGIASHHAGFVSSYPHDDGPAEDVYNGTDEKMPPWGTTFGGPSPGFMDAVWIGGDYDQKYSPAPCGALNDCWAPPPVDGLYRGWRRQGWAVAPCNCPPEVQDAYFSANRGMAMFDLHDVPDHARVTGVSFEAHVVKAFDSAERLDLRSMGADRSIREENLPGSGFEYGYDDAGDGTLYASRWDVGRYVAGDIARVALNPAAIADVQAALARNWFGIGLVSAIGETASTGLPFGAVDGSAANTPPRLLVDYDFVVPDPPLLVDIPVDEATGDGESTCTPRLTWDVPNEEDGNDLHFDVHISDTGPVYFVENFLDWSHLSAAQTTVYGMVDTTTHDVFDASGGLVRTVVPCVHMDPLDVTLGTLSLPYGRHYNVGWRFERPIVVTSASDTYTANGYTTDGLSDGLAGFTYMEWGSVNTILHPTTWCQTALGYAANLTAVGGLIPPGITESFEVAVDLDDAPDAGFRTVATVTNASDAFLAQLDPPIENVLAVRLVFTGSSDGYAYMSDLQIFDSEIYDTTTAQTVTSEVIGRTSNPAYPIGHATLFADDDVPAGTSIAYEMSNDDGATWVLATKGVDLRFPGNGNRVRWRAHLRTTDRRITPRIFRVEVNNLIGGPRDSAVDLAGFEENRTGPFLPMVSAGVPEAAGNARQARNLPVLPLGTYYWDVRAHAPSGSDVQGDQSDTWKFTVVGGAGPPPADISPALRARRPNATDIDLYWTLYVPAPGLHYHIHRNTIARDLTPLLAESPVRDYTDTTAVQWLYFYDIRAADSCHAESAD
jgi:hypothetical protein